MSEYIKREDVLSLSHYDDYDCEIVDVEDVEKLPFADVRPVVRGTWEKNGWSIRCSVCGYDMPFATRNFCPNCGADMREER